MEPKCEDVYDVVQRQELNPYKPESYVEYEDPGKIIKNQCLTKGQSSMGVAKDLRPNAMAIGYGGRSLRPFLRPKVLLVVFLVFFQNGG